MCQFINFIKLTLKERLFQFGEAGGITRQVTDKDVRVVDVGIDWDRE